MKKADVFLSYEHSMRTVVEHICSVLEADGISCWYAPRDVMGDYATSIVDAIDNARVFVSRSPTSAYSTRRTNSRSCLSSSTTIS